MEAEVISEVLLSTKASPDACAAVKVMPSKTKPVPIEGEVSVLLVKVWVPVRVTSPTLVV